jgi:hypothetical protein
MLLPAHRSFVQIGMLPTTAKQETTKVEFGHLYTAQCRPGVTHTSNYTTMMGGIDQFWYRRVLGKAKLMIHIYICRSGSSLPRTMISPEP